MSKVFIVDLMSPESVLKKHVDTINEVINRRKSYENLLVALHVKSYSLTVGMEVRHRYLQKTQSGYKGESDFTLIEEVVKISKITIEDNYILAYKEILINNKKCDDVFAMVKDGIWISLSSELPLLKLLKKQ